MAAITFLFLTFVIRFEILWIFTQYKGIAINFPEDKICSK